jgi:hypothetical protein
MRPVRSIATVLLAATVTTLTLLAAPVSAAPIVVHASPSPVVAGHTVTLSGSVGPDGASSDCAAIALYSLAFTTTNDLTVAPVYATAKPDGTFTTTATIPRAKPAGTYPIYLRCGGATAGGGTLVVRTAPTTPPVNLQVSPSRVVAGHTVTVSGSVGPDGAGSGCASRVTLISKAFAHTHDFAGLPAVVAAVRPDRTFTTTTTIPRATATGTYTITGRCGGANLGVSATLWVQAAPTSSNPLLVPLGSHQFGNLRAPDAIVAQAGPNQVGFYSPPKGADGLSFGPWSFDVARDGSVWLLDEVNHRLLVWQSGQPDRPARSVPLPPDPLERIADFAVAPDHTIYATYVPPPGPGPKTLRLCALSSSGQVRWTAPTIDEIFNARLRIGPDGALYVVGGLEQAGTHDYWTPLTTPAGRPLPLAEQRRRTSPQQPLPGGLRLTVTYVSAHEQHVTLSNQAGQPVRAWRITSHNELGGSTATPALVGGDPVVVFGVSQQTKAKFLYENLVLRLAPKGGTRQRFAIKADSRAVWGDTPITGVRVGPDGQLYQLRTDRATGASIARYSLTPIDDGPPTTTPTPTTPPATTPAVNHPPVSQPPVSAPAATGSAAQPATPAAAQSARRWIIPGLAAVGSGALAALGVWLLYRRRHPTGPSRQGRSRMAH